MEAVEEPVQTPAVETPVVDTPAVEEVAAASLKQRTVPAAKSSPTKAPEWLAPMVAKIGPAQKKCEELAEKAAPYVEKAQEAWAKFYKIIEPYNPEELIPMFLGLCLMFFGGSFVTLIAAVEAVRMSGLGQMKSSYNSITKNMKAALDASKKDDAVDDDNDGIADVQQIDQKALLVRKVMLLFKVVNPEEVSQALNGFYTCFLAVLTTLQIQFARVIALGASIGDNIAKPAHKYLEPQLQKVIPEEHHKWIPLVIDYCSRSIGMTLAWALQRLISALHSAMKGSEMFVDSLTAYTQKMGHAYLTDGNLDEYLSYALAVAGVYFQLSYGFSLPWLLYIPLFPFVIAEWVLVTVVSFF